MTARVADWERRGSHLRIGGRRLFVAERPGEGTPLLLLHGYPSSSYDWRLLVDRLAGRPIVSFDFLGFGLSEKPPDHVYSLHGQADLVEALAAELGLERVVLVAHDMGTSVATELLARDLEGRLGFALESVLLLNGSMVLEAASLTVSQRLLRSRLGPLMARASSERFFRWQFGRIFAPAAPLTAEEAADQWALLAREGGNRIADRLTFYLHERVRFAGRWHGALRDWPGRLELGWALADPVCTEAVLEAVLALRPAAPVTRWEGVGHYPQIERPELVAAAVGRIAA
jgi:pimeloyl-ACP methyl ester carboxylesterase